MNSHSSFISVILVAGGVGARMKCATPKQYLLLEGKPLVLHSFFLFAALPTVGEIIVVCEEQYRHLFPLMEFPEVRFAFPGPRRQDSVWNGFCETSPAADLICIHDSARPFLSREDCQAVFEAGHLHRAAVLGVPLSSTIKEGTLNRFVHHTLDRSLLWEIQTPQVITPKLLHEGFAKAREMDRTVTDDVSLVELLGFPVKLVQGSTTNIKITTPSDLELAEALYPIYEKNQAHHCL